MLDATLVGAPPVRDACTFPLPADDDAMLSACAGTAVDVNPVPTGGAGLSVRPAETLSPSTKRVAWAESVVVQEQENCSAEAIQPAKPACAVTGQAQAHGHAVGSGLVPILFNVALIKHCRLVRTWRPIGSIGGFGGAAACPVVALEPTDNKRCCSGCKAKNHNGGNRSGEDTKTT